MESVSVDRIHVGIEHDGDLGLLPDIAYTIENLGSGGAGHECAGSRLLVDGAIGERVGKGDAKFQQIYSSAFQSKGYGFRRGQCGVSGADIRDHRGLLFRVEVSKDLVDTIWHRKVTKRTADIYGSTEAKRVRSSQKTRSG